MLEARCCFWHVLRAERIKLNYLNWRNTLVNVQTGQPKVLTIVAVDLNWRVGSLSDLKHDMVPMTTTLLTLAAQVIVWTLSALVSHTDHFFVADVTPDQTMDFTLVLFKFLEHNLGVDFTNFFSHFRDKIPA